jgi:hypothetical protein
MNIRRKVTHTRLNPRIQGTAIRQMTTETHTRCTDATIARRQREEVVDAQTGVFVVGGQFLGLSALYTKTNPNSNNAGADVDV